MGERKGKSHQSIVISCPDICISLHFPLRDKNPLNFLSTSFPIFSPLSFPILFESGIKTQSGLNLHKYEKYQKSELFLLKRRENGRGRRSREPFCSGSLTFFCQTEDVPLTVTNYFQLTTFFSLKESEMKLRLTVLIYPPFKTKAFVSNFYPQK